MNVQCTGEPVDVRLEPWPAITLRFPDLPALPAGLGYETRLRPAVESSRRYSAVRQKGAVSALFGPPVRGIEIENGRAEVPIGDDASVVELFVCSVIAGKRTSTLVTIPRQEVRFTTPTYTVRFTAKAVLRAITALRSQR